MLGPELERGLHPVQKESYLSSFKVCWLHNKTILEDLTSKWLFCYRLMEERRERINNFLSKLMKEKFDNEDLIIARDIAEAEAEWEKREREKYEKNKAELKAIAEHRALVVSNSLSKNQTKWSPLLQFLLTYSLCFSDRKLRDLKNVA